jgi:hypothetical protein
LVDDGFIEADSDYLLRVYASFFIFSARGSEDFYPPSFTNGLSKIFGGLLMKSGDFGSV